jgi:hypothetical protein
MQENGDIFITSYQCFDPQDGIHMLDIIATHYKSKKLIVIEDIVAGTNGKEYMGFKGPKQVTYEEPFKEGYGIIGARAYAGNRVPYELLIAFVSSSYENVEIINLMTSVFDLEYIVLDE